MARQRNNWMLAVVLFLPLWGCTQEFEDIRVMTQNYAKAPSNNYRSYAWAAAAAMVNDPDRDWVSMDLDIGSEIKFLVDRELRGHGMTEASTTPDALVLYAIGVDMKALDIVIEADDKMTIKETPTGALTVIVVDASTRQLLWAGHAEADVQTEPKVELAKKRLDYAITKMFKAFLLP